MRPTWNELVTAPSATRRPPVAKWPLPVIVVVLVGLTGLSGFLAVQPLREVDGAAAVVCTVLSLAVGLGAFYLGVLQVLEANVPARGGRTPAPLSTGVGVVVGVVAVAVHPLLPPEVACVVMAAVTGVVASVTLVLLLWLPALLRRWDLPA